MVDIAFLSNKINELTKQLEANSLNDTELTKDEIKSKRKKIRKELRYYHKLHIQVLGKKLRFLHKVLTKLFFYYPVKPVTPKEYWTDGNMALYYCEFGNQAEIISTWSLPIDERIRINYDAYKKYKKQYIAKNKIIQKKSVYQLKLFSC